MFFHVQQKPIYARESGSILEAFKMNFHIEFKTTSGAVYTAPARRLGLKDVDKIRAKFGPDVRLEDIVGDINASWPSTVRMYIAEQEARMVCTVAGHFTDDHIVCVTVPPGAFDKYLIDVPTKYSRDVFGITVDVDCDQILQDWMAAGCPREWQP